MVPFNVPLPWKLYRDIAGPSPSFTSPVPFKSGVSAATSASRQMIASGCTALAEVIIPKTVAAIGHSAFVDTPWLAENTSNPAGKWLIVGDGVLLKFYGKGALGVKVPDTVKYISDAFRGNTKLIKITVQGGCKVVGEYAFADCTSLHEISLPLKLDYLANSSVYGCTALELIDNKD